MGTREFRHEHESETPSVPRPVLGVEPLRHRADGGSRPGSVTPDQPLVT